MSCVEALAALPKLAALELHMGQEQMDALAISAVTGARAGQWLNALGCLRLATQQMDQSTTAFVAAIRSPRLRELQSALPPSPEPTRSPYRQSLNIFDLTPCFHSRSTAPKSR